jgi:hypothetical protein
MNRLASLLVIALLTGCASRGAIPATTARALPAQPARSTPPEAQVVELRHFYLLSPGPRATLVVTRSDLPSGDR